MRKCVFFCIFAVIMRKTVLSAFVVLGGLCAAAGGVGLEYSATMRGGGSTGTFAPYMIGSWDGGRAVNASGISLEAEIHKNLDLSRRFSWDAGVDLMTGYQSAVDYARYSATDGWYTHSTRPSAAWIQQLYASVKFRGVFLSAGMRERTGWIVDSRLSSGDLIRSNNARPIPGVTAGFIDFQNIPFTNGWVQICGEINYGRMFDGGFKADRYNYYQDLLAQNLCYTYKYCYFRTKPSKPLSVTLGMQTAGFFGGKTHWYDRGVMVRSQAPGFHLKDLWEMFFPSLNNGDAYYKGSSLGSWDFNARYRLPNGDRLTAYFEWPWEDGSGIGRRNGWDGLWGIGYATDRMGWLTGAVIEYLDFRNHSGPMHYAPGDHPGTTIPVEATGGDNYFNNDMYGPYSNYGMAIGSPFLLSPVYNTDGFWAFAHNRAQGMHMAVSGRPHAEWAYALRFSWQQAWGMGRLEQHPSLKSTSLGLDLDWTPARFRGWSAKAQVAFDAGRLRGDNFGVFLAVKYAGNFTIGK